MEKTLQIQGMSCSGCQKKITEALNSLPNIHAHVSLEKNEATIHSDHPIDVEFLNQEIKKIGNYQLVDPSVAAPNTFVKPQDRVSPSSVYYCPMECEGEKVYFKQSERCPVCKMYLVPIEEKKGSKQTATFSKTNLPESFKTKIGEHYCPMFCEGDKTYKEPADCPICHMHLEPISEDLVKNGYSHGHSHTHHHEHENNHVSDALVQNESNAGKYYCPMFCEGDKVYDSNVGCPVCGMDLVKIPEKQKTTYTCPMHAEIVQDHPGDCPICGMDLVPMASKNNSAEDETYKNLRNKFSIALVFTVPLFIISMGGMWIDWPFSHQVQGYIELVLTLPVLFYAGWFIMVRGWRSFKTWKLNMFSLIALGVGAAVLFSIFALVFPNALPHELQHGGKAPLYFESVAVILTLVIMGQMLEAKAHQRTGKAIEELMNLAPETANLVVDGKEKIVAVSEIKKGAILRIKSGEKIPVDGKVLEGTSSVDESMISGEPMPVHKEKGDPLTSGTLNQNGSILMEAEKVGDETVLAHIIKMVHEASRSKAPIQKLVDKVSSVFVPVVIGISVLTFVLWFIFGGENRIAYAITNAIAVLIVACPCALGLATPMSLMVGIGKGAKNGILIKSAEALEEMNKVDTLITDKTGTLTEGKPSVKAVYACGNSNQNEVLQIAASLNAHSDHPLSKAVMKKVEENHSESLAVDQFENITGNGVSGFINNTKYFLGNDRLMKAQNLAFSSQIEAELAKPEFVGKTISFLANEKEIIGIISFEDQLKATSKQAINFLHKKGVKVIMMTGDNEVSAKTVAQTLNIDEYKASCLPEDKMNAIKNLQNEGKVVAMTGDGINDAPALAQSNVGIAMGTGSDAAIESSEITLIKGDILGIAKAKILSEKLLRNIKENLFFAFIYNVVGIPIAAGVLYSTFGILLSPMIAAAAMSLSSVSVILNSLRLNSAKLDLDA